MSPKLNCYSLCTITLASLVILDMVVPSKLTLTIAILDIRIPTSLSMKGTSVVLIAIDYNNGCVLTMLLLVVDPVAKSNE